MKEPFQIKDCALVAIATGERAQNLRELRDRLERTHPGCLYYHFWGSRLRPKFDDPEFQNDLAVWAFYGLNDTVLAERLALVAPTDFQDLEDLRREVLDLIEERLDEIAWVPWAKSDRQFHFIRSQIVVFDTRIRIDSPAELARLVPAMDLGSIFYHFIDARRRTPTGRDDFTEWLVGLREDHIGLVEGLAAVDPYFASLRELREELNRVFAECLAS
jgi:hypothetical protein